MFPTIFCENTISGAISVVSKADDFVDRDLTSISSLLRDRLGRQNIDGEIWYIKEVEYLRFCIQSKINFTNIDGKKVFSYIDEREANKIASSLYDLIDNQTADIINYTHDIQYLIGNLNHNAVVYEYQKNDINLLRTKLSKINELTVIISAKNAYFRYITEDIELIDKKKISIVDRVFKVSKSVKFLSESFEKNMDVDFSTYPDRTKAFVETYDFFEFIPFQIVENAIKYSPKDDDLEIEVRDEKDSILITFSSGGPKIEQDEYHKIFEKKVRGRAARKYFDKGHGLGLYQTSKALHEVFNGRIWVEQRPISYVTMNGIEYFETKFFIRLKR